MAQEFNLTFVIYDHDGIMKNVERLRRITRRVLNTPSFCQKTNMTLYYIRILESFSIFKKYITLPLSTGRPDYWKII